MIEIKNIETEVANDILSITHRNHGHSVVPNNDGTVNILFESEWDSKGFKAAYNYIHRKNKI